ncbi:MAG TPA: DUF302 domain-containing protein [bacterium]|nr:DUF302 domain-containing protein [bacterium]
MKSTNLFRLFFAVTMLALLFAGTQTLLAQDSGVVTVQSKSSFDNTVESLRKMVAQNEMMVLAEIDHGKILSMTGLKLNGIALFVGNSVVGKQLFTANKAVGVAVPIRVNVYEEDDGKTYVNYVKPSSQLAPFANDQIKMVAQMLDEKLQALTSMLAK